MKHVCCYITSLLIVLLSVTDNLYAQSPIDSTTIVNEEILPPQEERTIAIISSYFNDSRRTTEFIDRFGSLIEECKLPYKLVMNYMAYQGFEGYQDWKSRMREVMNQYQDENLAAVILLGNEAWISYIEQDKLLPCPYYGVYINEYGLRLPEYMPDFSYWYPESEDMRHMAQRHPDYKHTGGMTTFYDMEANIELIRSIYPNVDRIAFVTDNTYPGAAMRTRMRQVIVDKYPEINLTTLSGLRYNLSQIKTRINRLPEKSKCPVVLLGSFRVDKTGRYYPPSTLKELVPDSLNMPVFTLDGTGLGTVAIGGCMPVDDVNCDHILDDIIANTNGEITLSNFKRTENQYRFDRTMLEKYNIEPSLLPPNSIIESPTDERVERYRRLLWTTILVAVVFLILIVLVLGLYIRYKMISLRLKESNANLALAKEKAEESDRLKSAFLANMSHEIRTPLNAIVGFSQLMIDAESNDERLAYWDIIHTNNEQLLRLIGDILDLSKIESGMMEFRDESFDMELLMAEIYASMDQRLTNREVQLLYEPRYIGCMIKQDRNRIMQIVTNFVTNSIKFTSKGYIKMGYLIEDGGIKLYVEDTGIGIEKEKQDKVFQRFYKLNDFAQGTGLGMSICRAICENRGGRIGLESEFGKGSTFWAWLPVSEIEVLNDDINENIDLNSAEDVPIPPGDYQMNILISEDNDIHFLLLERLLSRFGQVTRAHNGQEAVELVSTNHYTFILMDVNMPVMNGWEAIETIRKVNKDVYIAAMSAKVFPTDRVECERVGGNTFLPKPIKREELRKILKRFI